MVSSAGLWSDHKGDIFEACRSHFDDSGCAVFRGLVVESAFAHSSSPSHAVYNDTDDHYPPDDPED